MSHTSTVLIVDDEPAGRDTLEALLLPQDYRLILAGSGPEALALARRHSPDVVLLDVMMPGMDGFEVCRGLRADAQTAEVPVLLVTALDDRESCLEGLAAGADDFISKPFDRAELRARVQTIVRLNRYRRLLAERARLEWVVEHAQDGYVILDEAGRIGYANPQAYQLLGQPDPRLAADVDFLAWVENHFRCVPPEVWADWPAPSPGRRYLVQPETETARSFWLRVDVFAGPSGPEKAWIVRLRNVTAEMSLQRDVWRFHSMVSHKLRSPLAGLMGSVELLATEAGAAASDTLCQLAGIALRSATALTQDIKSIFEHLDSDMVGVLESPGTVADLPGMATAIAEALRIAPVVVRLAPEVAGARLRLSRPALELVLWELFKNAHKFHPAHAPRLEVAVQAAGAGAVQLSVADDGQTLSPEQLAQVWMPYYQGEKHFSGSAPGLGLGLSMVATLLWEAGGGCRMFNRAGPGVVVELVVPLTVPLSSRHQSPVSSLAGPSVGIASRR